MPTYDYECPKCGRYEVRQGILDKPLEVCHTCGSPVRRLIGKGGFLKFHGSGFYAIDYGKENSNADDTS